MTIADHKKVDLARANARTNFLEKSRAAQAAKEQLDRAFVQWQVCAKALVAATAAMDEAAKSDDNLVELLAALERTSLDD